MSAAAQAVTAPAVASDRPVTADQPAWRHPAPAWLLPMELAGEGGRPRRRRTARDWAADATLFAIAVVSGLLTLANPPYFNDTMPAWVITADPFAGLLACLSLWFRRRYPVAVALFILPMFLIGNSATAPALIAVLTVAIHRRWLAAVLVTDSFLVPSVWFTLSTPPPDVPAAAMVVIVTLMFVVPLAWGMAVRARRQLVASLRRDAERAAREHALRLSDARRAERARIAREMHDTLAHRISLISVHAGALAYRTAQTDAGTGRPLDPADVGQAIGVIHGNARRALVELGDVLEVLRTGSDDHPDEAAEAPQPRLTDISRLVADAQAVGQRVTYELVCAPGAAEALRPAVQRTVYRTVQEGLTNARKHAPGAAVRVRVIAAPDEGITACVSNPSPVGPSPPTVPGAGVGLAGLAERVALEGGTIEHGVAGGSFRLVTRLPWPA